MRGRPNDAGIGIGKATSITLSKAGYRVVLVARREAELNATAQECPSETLVTPGDVTDEVFAAKVFEEAVKKFGISLPAVPIEDIPVQDFRRVIDVNLTSAFIFTREAFKVFKTQTPRGGRSVVPRHSTS
ncbi:short chain dehydrogenase domain-containing protein [Rhizoctonia solani AG-1 IA]|uniref:Short chain dehydrogenase domain-containing protein n=1 Tax=Thanatephorus cucumeris (strain AG1-IA) TaxID=983506 RepID=L8WPY9_THACA|nr:short chain dehydrogenase domain-containing protein [Rhizoctonia solani AG-1 IA]